VFQCVMCTLTYGFMTCLSLIPGQTYRYEDERDRYGGESRDRDRRQRRDGGPDSHRYGGGRVDGAGGKEHARDGYDGRSRRFSGEAGSVRIRDERRSRYS
jgi:hypothetical protein